jgi:hypothetical protein
MWNYNLADALDHQHRLEKRVTICRYPVARFDFAGLLKTEIAKKYGLSETGDLAQLHVTLADQIDAIFEGKTHWYDQLSELGPEINDAYADYICWLHQELGFDFVFERNPAFRYHIPRAMSPDFRRKDGKVFSLHTDTMLGDYFQQINAWMPLCDVFGSAALLVCDPDVSDASLRSFAQAIGFDTSVYRSSRKRFFDFAIAQNDGQELLDASRPLAMSYGECLMMDPRVLHGTSENVSDRTRVSMDFRVLPVDVYERSMAEMGAVGHVGIDHDGDLLEKGAYYHVLTAGELLKSREVVA